MKISLIFSKKKLGRRPKTFYKDKTSSISCVFDTIQHEMVILSSDPDMAKQYVHHFLIHFLYSMLIIFFCIQTTRISNQMQKIFSHTKTHKFRAMRQTLFQAKDLLFQIPSLFQCVHLKKMDFGPFFLCLNIF